METPTQGGAALAPTTGSASSARREMRKIMDVNRALKRDADSRLKLSQIKQQLDRMSREIEDSVRVEYTGEFVLLKRNGDSWTCLGIFNPDTWEGDEPEWDQCLPIPKVETIPDFAGW